MAKGSQQRWVRRVVVRGLVLAIGVVLAGQAAGAQATTARPTPLQQMAKEAKITKEQARLTALQRVPGGRMSTIELRRGIMGKLVYIALIQEPGKTAMTEVTVDAMTGVVLSKRP